jgi:hypothetical protein
LDATLGQTLGGLISTGANIYGAQNAAEAQTGAELNAINTQQGALGNINSLWGSQTSVGNAATATLGNTLGIGGAPANYSNFYNMPGYQFAVQQGTQAIDRQAAAGGSAYTPNTLAAVGQYVTGTASQDYNNYVQQLLSTAGLATSANTSLTGANLTTAGNTSQLQQNIGNAQASGVAGSASAIGTALSKLPWGSIGTGIGNLINGGSSNSGAGSVSSGIDTTNAGILNGYTSYPSNGYGNINVGNTTYTPDSSGVNSGGLDLSNSGITSGYTDYSSGP